MTLRLKVVRLAKTALLFSTAVYFTIVTINNLTDYWMNFEIIRHVMLMDDVYPQSRLLWHSISSTVAMHIVYWVIILWLAAAGLFCWIGCVRCAANITADKEAFDRGIVMGVTGLATGMTLWLLVFMGFAQEWFAMWQSAKWNVSNDAFRMFVANGIVLSFLMLRDEAQ